jgi:hypothetical protein
VNAATVFGSSTSKKLNGVQSVERSVGRGAALDDALGIQERRADAGAELLEIDVAAGVAQLAEVAVVEIRIPLPAAVAERALEAGRELVDWRAEVVDAVAVADRTRLEAELRVAEVHAEWVVVAVRRDDHGLPSESIGCGAIAEADWSCCGTAPCTFRCVGQLVVADDERVVRFLRSQFRRCR